MHGRDIRLENKMAFKKISVVCLVFNVAVINVLMLAALTYARTCTVCVCVSSFGISHVMTSVGR